MARIGCTHSDRKYSARGEHITAEHWTSDTSHGPADEIGRLIDVLNATFERLQGSFEQAARFSADASHQLKTPIAVLRAGIEEIRCTRII